MLMSEVCEVEKVGGEQACEERLFILGGDGDLSAGA